MLDKIKVCVPFVLVNDYLLQFSAICLLFMSSTVQSGVWSLQQFICIYMHTYYGFTFLWDIPSSFSVILLKDPFSPSYLDIFQSNLQLRVFYADLNPVCMWRIRNCMNRQSAPKPQRVETFEYPKVRMSMDGRIWILLCFIR